MAKDPEWLASWLLLALNAIIIIPTYIYNLFFVSILGFYVVAFFYNDYLKNAGIFLNNKKITLFFGLEMFVLMLILVFLIQKETALALWSAILTALLGSALTYLGMLNE